MTEPAAWLTDPAIASALNAPLVLTAPCQADMLGQEADIARAGDLVAERTHIAAVERNRDAALGVRAQRAGHPAGHAVAGDPPARGATGRRPRRRCRPA